MFDLGFIKDIRFLLRRMPIRTTRQTLLFSATLSHRVLELAYEHMNEPEKLVVEAETVTAARVRQKMYFPANEEKLPLLIGLLSRSEGARTMVFVNTKAWVEKVARALEKAGYRVGVLSGDVPQKKRESLLRRFQAGQLELLVATDVAARGLHIDGVSHVFNYDLPFDAEDYVHRIGRTARLGAEGDAISFACERYAMGLPDIEAFIDQKIPVEPVSPDLLEALPRTPRARPEGEAADEDEGESIGEIFREAREQRAADEARRGGGGRGPRGERAERSGEGGQRRRRPRKPRAEGEAASTHDAVAAETAPAKAAQPPAARAPADAQPGEDKPPRKRRRRRRGKRIEGAGEGTATGSAPRQDGAPRAPRKPAAERPAARKASDTQAPAPKAQDASPSLLGRIGRGLKSLVTRAPRSQH
jgi:ATP-dependent RNA helicase RhlB